MRVVYQAKCYKVSCPRCMSVLEFTLDDITPCDYDRVDSGKVNCPVCGTSIVVRRYDDFSFGSSHTTTKMTDNVSVEFKPSEGACVNTTEVDNGE